MKEKALLTSADLERIYDALQKEDHKTQTPRCPVCHRPVYVIYPDNPTGMCFDCAAK